MRPTRFTWENPDSNTGRLAERGENFISSSTFSAITIGTRYVCASFYGQYKNLLAGQTWSAFADPDAFPDTLEFEDRRELLRQEIRRFAIRSPWTNQTASEFSVEKSGVDTPSGTPFGTPIGTSIYPDFVAFYHNENKYGHIHAAGLSEA